MITLNRMTTVTYIHQRDGDFYEIRREFDAPRRYKIGDISNASLLRISDFLREWPFSIDTAGGWDYEEVYYMYNPSWHAPDRPITFAPSARGGIASGPDDLLTE